MGPAELRALAERNRKEAARLRAEARDFLSRDTLTAAEAADAAEGLDLAETLEDLATKLERKAGKLEGTGEIFHTRSQKSSRVAGEMNATAKLNMSRASSDDPFVKAIRAKGLTQNDLARALGIPVSLLSMYRNGKRRIPQDRAETIEKLTGWKAVDKNWPGKMRPAD